MEIILLEKIVNLGELGDVVNVKDGFGRNFLIPQGKAKRATAQNMEEFKVKKAELEKQQAALEKLSQQRAKKLEGVIILLEKIVNLGELGDVVNVKDGFGRNFLIPQGKAKRATAQNMEEFKVKKAELEKQQAALEKLSQQRAKKLDGVSIKISQKAGVDGKLFGSVSNIDISEALAKEGHEVVKSEIRLPEGPLKSTGEFDITIDLQNESTALIKVTIEGEE